MYICDIEAIDRVFTRHITLKVGAMEIKLALSPEDQINLALAILDERKHYLNVPVTVYCPSIPSHGEQFVAINEKTLNVREPESFLIMEANDER